MKANRWLIALALALLAGTGCEAGEDAPGADPGLEVGEAAEPDAAIEPTAPTPGVLTPINRSGVRGMVDVEGSGDEVLFNVDLEGLEPGTEYTAHLHEGRCAAGGPALLPLGPVLASQQGSGSLELRTPTEGLGQDAELFVQILGPDESPVACANVERP